MNVKLRVESNEEEIKKFIEILMENKNVVINNVSDIYPNRGISVYNRCYVEIEIKKHNDD